MDTVIHIGSHYAYSPLRLVHGLKVLDWSGLMVQKMEGDYWAR